MPKAKRALESAPGVLAVKVDFAAGQATIGTETGKPVPRDEILAALEKVGYSGQFIDEASGGP